MTDHAQTLLDRRYVLVALASTLAACRPGQSEFMPAVTLAPVAGLTSRSGQPLPGVATEAQGSRLLVVNFWGTWCPTCQSEHQALMALSNDPRIKLVGVAIRDTERAVAHYLAQRGNPYEAVSIDHDRTLAGAAGLRGVPTKALVSADRRIITTLVGPANSEGVQAQLSAVIKQAMQQPVG